MSRAGKRAAVPGQTKPRVWKLLLAGLTDGYGRQERVRVATKKLNDSQQYEMIDDSAAEAFDDRQDRARNLDVLIKERHDLPAFFKHRLWPKINYKLTSADKRDTTSAAPKKRLGNIVHSDLEWLFTPIRSYRKAHGGKLKQRIVWELRKKQLASLNFLFGDGWREVHVIDDDCWKVQWARFSYSPTTGNLNILYQGKLTSKRLR